MENTYGHTSKRPDPFSPSEWEVSKSKRTRLDNDNGYVDGSTINHTTFPPPSVSLEWSHSQLRHSGPNAGFAFSGDERWYASEPVGTEITSSRNDVSSTMDVEIGPSDHTWPTSFYSYEDTSLPLSSPFSTFNNTYQFSPLTSSFPAQTSAITSDVMEKDLTVLPSLGGFGLSDIISNQQPNFGLVPQPPFHEGSQEDIPAFAAQNFLWNQSLLSMPFGQYSGYHKDDNLGLSDAINPDGCFNVNQTPFQDQRSASNMTFAPQPDMIEYGETILSSNDQNLAPMNANFEAKLKIP